MPAEIGVFYRYIPGWIPGEVESARDFWWTIVSCELLRDRLVVFRGGRLRRIGRGFG
jgi:hypothetical protein